MGRTSNGNDRAGRGGAGRNSRQTRGQRGGKGTSNDAKKKDKKFHPWSRSKPSDFTFTEVKDELTLTLQQKKMDHAPDIVNTVRKMKLINFEDQGPVLRFSELEDPTNNEKENNAFAVIHRDEIKQWNERKKDYESNLMNLHATIVKFCSSTMREKLEREADWETDLFEDPIKLLKRIKRLMTTSDETDWEQFSLWEAIRKFVNCKQKENEDVGSYRRRFEENARSLQNLMGDKWLNEFMTKTKG